MIRNCYWNSPSNKYIFQCPGSWRSSRGRPPTSGTGWRTSSKANLTFFLLIKSDGIEDSLPNIICRILTIKKFPRWIRTFCTVCAKRVKLDYLKAMEIYCKLTTFWMFKIILTNVKLCFRLEPKPTENPGRKAGRTQGRPSAWKNPLYFKFKTV